MEKVCVGVLLFLLVVAVLSHLRAVHPVHWFIRVGFPEIGWSFLVVAVPAALVLGRTSPKLAAGIFAALLTFIVLPWMQALQVASSLQERWGDPFTRRVDRHPLFLGSRESHTRVTEIYKTDLLWDRYTPQGDIKARLLFVHGGSWRNGTRDEFPQMFAYLADRGYEVLSITYTLSGVAPYPAASMDVAAAIEKAYSPDLPLFIAGRSSGGHLALLGAYTHPDLLRGAIGFYSPIDMEWSYEHPSNPAVLNSPEAIVQFLGVRPDQAPDLYEETSPIERVGPQGPPTLLIHGQPDCLVYHRQSEMLSERLGELGVDHFFLSLPWMEHGGDITVHGPSGRLSAWAMESFMESLL